MTYEEKRLELTKQHGSGEITDREWIQESSFLIFEEIERLQLQVNELQEEGYELLTELEKLDGRDMKERWRGQDHAVLAGMQDYGE